MGTFTVGATTTGTLDPWKRVRYSLGLVLGEAEFQQDQLYHMERGERHHRALHGYGVVSGLAVSFDDTAQQVVVGPGLAVDGHGRWICVDVEQCLTMEGLATWVGEQEDTTPNDDGTLSIWVTLCHLDCPTDEVPVPSGPCKTADESMAASRIADSFALDLSLEAPPAIGESAAAGFSEFIEFLASGGGEPESEEAPPPAVRLRRALAEWVRSRPDHPEIESACLDADGCLSLAELRVTLNGDGAVDVDVVPAIRPGGHPNMISTEVLTEWLLALSAGLGDPELAFDDLTDVEAASAGERDLIIKGADGWAPGRIRLDELDDVEVDAASIDQILTRRADGVWVGADAPETGGQPTGPAGGDLTGTYPNPRVAGIVGVEVDPDLPDDRRRALGWNPATKVWEAQSYVHAPAGPYAIVAAGDFPAWEEGPFEPYNLRVQWLRAPLTYNLSFAGYEDPADSRVRYVVKGDIVVNADDRTLAAFRDFVGNRFDIGGDGTHFLPPLRFVTVRYQARDIRVQLASNLILRNEFVPVELFAEFFKDLRVQVEISAHGPIQRMIAAGERAEER